MTTRDEARRDVRLAVQGAMAKRQWNQAQLIEQAGIDRATLSAFLDGGRWPQGRTLARIESALGWEPGAIARMLEGEQVDAVATGSLDVRGTATASPVGGGIDPEVLVELASLDPNSVARVKDFIRGIKAGG